jgi:CCR4-NOT transcription complex subunit 1
VGDKSGTDSQGKQELLHVMFMFIHCNATQALTFVSLFQLVDSNGMEVFPKYFRRLLTGNSPQIFPGVNKSVENAGNYPLLVQELQRVSQDPDQAQKIADTIDTSEGDIFRDFDLSSFLDHFQLDPLLKATLLLAFHNVSKTDLRSKGVSCFIRCLQFF